MLGNVELIRFRFLEFGYLGRKDQILMFSLFLKNFLVLVCEAYRLKVLKKLFDNLLV